MCHVHLGLLVLEGSGTHLRFHILQRRHAGLLDADQRGDHVVAVDAEGVGHVAWLGTIGPSHDLAGIGEAGDGRSARLEVAGLDDGVTEGVSRIAEVIGGTVVDGEVHGDLLGGVARALAEFDALLNAVHRDGFSRPLLVEHLDEVQAVVGLGGANLADAVVEAEVLERLDHAAPLELQLLHPWPWSRDPRCAC